MDISVVRRVASAHEYDETLYAAREGAVVFQSTSKNATVQVWYRAGTAAVLVPHPRRAFYSSFFFNVTDEETLAALLASPFETPFGDTNKAASAPFRQLADPASPVLALASPALDYSRLIESEEAAIRRQLRIVQSELDDLQKEHAILQKRLLVISDNLSPRSSDIGSDDREEQHGRNENEAATPEHLKREVIGSVSYPSTTSIEQRQRSRSGTMNTGGNPATAMAVTHAHGATKIANPRAGNEPFLSQKSTVALNRSASSFARESPSRRRGNRCLYCFTNQQYQKSFAEAWADRPVSCVALDQGYAIVYDDGSVTWWNVPKALDVKLRDDATQLPPVKFIAFGPQESYFIKFASGKMEWVSNSSFQTALRRSVEEQGLFVSSVSFGPGGSWVIVFTDGSVEWAGVPTDLENLLLRAAEAGPAVRDVTLGPAGEWFCILTDNSVQANNVPDSLHEVLGQIKSSGGRVRSIVFGQQGTWYLRYWNGNHS